MIKKLLILLLFFGFSYGQDKPSIGLWENTPLVGVWDCFSCEGTYRLILKEDGTGLFSVEDFNENKILNRRIKWETFITLSNIDKKGQQGVLTIELNQENFLTYDYDFLKFSKVDKELNDMFLEISPQGKTYSGNDVLMLKNESSKGKGYIVLEKK